jgi:hypothetical protein
LPPSLAGLFVKTGPVAAVHKACPHPRVNLIRGCGGISGLRFRVGFLVGKSTSVPPRVDAVRAAGSKGDLGQPDGPRSNPSLVGSGLATMGCSRHSKSASVTAACKLAPCVAASVRGAILCLPVFRHWAHAARSRARVTAGGVGGRESGSGRGRGTRLACSGFVLFAEVNERRLAQRSHSGCGRGGGRGPSSKVGDH